MWRLTRITDPLGTERKSKADRGDWPVASARNVVGHLLGLAGGRGEAWWGVQECGRRLPYFRGSAHATYRATLTADRTTAMLVRMGRHAKDGVLRTSWERDVRDALAVYGTDREAAAKRLGVSVRQLRRYARELGYEPISPLSTRGLKLKTPTEKARMAWESMHSRCRPTASQHHQKSYYNRGIRVCERWASFDLFLEDVGLPTSMDHTLDRINNDIGYGPGNCRWATRSEQQRNKRKPTLSHKNDPIG